MALLPPSYLDGVVAIGVAMEPDKLTWFATGFLVGWPAEKDGIPGQHIFLVTNKHVLEGEDSIVVRFNPEKGKKIQNYSISLKDVKKQFPQRWVSHPNNIDVAVIGLDGAFLKKDGQQLLPFDRSAFLTIEEMDKNKVSEGDSIYVIGYPMGLVDPNWRYPIVRSGSIARIQDIFEEHRSELEGYRSEFLIDAFIFPGNSGSPVILKPESEAVEGTTPINFACVIGMVSSHMTYPDIAENVETQEQCVVFNDNSGLTNVIPSDFIKETIEEFIKKTSEGLNSTSLYLL